MLERLWNRYKETIPPDQYATQERIFKCGAIAAIVAVAESVKYPAIEDPAWQSALDEVEAFIAEQSRAALGRLRQVAQ